MAPMPVRRFTVADGLVLIAATAAGLAVARPLVLIHTGISRISTSGFASHSTKGAVCIIVLWLALSWTFAILLLRLRRPRPGRRELFRQPGFASGVAVSVALMIHALDFGALVMQQVFVVGRRFRDVEIYAMFYWNHAGGPYENGRLFAPAVAAVWLVLAAGGGWKSELSWIDRTGRVLGWFWITTAIGFNLGWFL